MGLPLVGRLQNFSRFEWFRLRQLMAARPQDTVKFELIWNQVRFLLACPLTVPQRSGLDFSASNIDMRLDFQD
jgi:hypothetical protein